MTAQATVTTRNEPMDRWDQLWNALPIAFVVIPALLSLTNEVRPLVLLLSALAIGWYWWMVLAHEEWQERLLPMLTYFAGLTTLTTALVWLDSSYFLMLIGTYVQAFILLPGMWAYGGALLATLSCSVGLVWEDFGVRNLPSLALSTAFTFAVGGTVRALANQNEQRRQMIGELEEQSVRLARLAEENADLQAQLLAQARESGVNAERQRMAREIHDTLAQGLIGIIAHLEAADRVLDDKRALRPRMATAQSMARDSLAEARRSVQALRPAPLADAMLPDALTKVAGEWSRSSGVRCEVTVTGTAAPLHPEVEVTLLRTAQEALANVSKHAGASRAGLTLSYMEDVVALDVKDDGGGFDPARQEGRTPGADGGFGLTAMRQRVTRLAGSLVIESAPGQGTGISATIPAIPAAVPNAASGEGQASAK